MSTPSSIEDHRGVDRAAIRELLQLTPPERVQRLIDIVAVWSEILEYARPRAGR